VFSTRNELDKVCNISGENNAGGLGAEPSAAGGKRGFEGGVLTLRRFLVFSQKIRIFKHSLVKTFA